MGCLGQLVINSVYGAANKLILLGIVSIDQSSGGGSPDAPLQPLPQNHLGDSKIPRALICPASWVCPRVSFWMDMRHHPVQTPKSTQLSSLELLTLTPRPASLRTRELGTLSSGARLRK